MNLIKSLSYTKLALVALVLSNSAFAGSIQNCDGGTGDYSDAPSSYGTACHDTNRWQQLGGDGVKGDSLPGDSVNDDNYDNKGWSGESSANDKDTGDNGVSWSVSEDGVNWTKFGRNEELVQGQFVKFKVNVKRSTEGNHQYDEYKLWLDWFGTGSFDETTDVVFNGEWDKNFDDKGNEFTGTRDSNFWNNDLNTYNSPDVWGKFFSDAIQVPTDSILGETWLRARVICENSLNSGNDHTLFATGYYHQGEVEDYALSIARKVSEVSEPSTVLLFSAALWGLVARNKKRS